MSKGNVVRLFDAHCHLQDPRIFHVAPQLIHTALDSRVLRFAVNGVSEKDWHLVKQMGEQYPCVIPCFGLHPWYVAERSPNWLKSLREFFETTPSAAVGEIGLDQGSHGKEINFVDQVQVFQQQLELAKEFERPVSVHCVRAFGDLLETMKEKSQKPQYWHIPPEFFDEIFKEAVFLKGTPGNLGSIDKNKFLYTVGFDKKYAGLGDMADGPVPTYFGKCIVIQEERGFVKKTKSVSLRPMENTEVTTSSFSMETSQVYADPSQDCYIPKISTHPMDCSNIASSSDFSMIDILRILDSVPNSLVVTGHLPTPDGNILEEVSAEDIATLDNISNDIILAGSTATVSFPEGHQMLQPRQENCEVDIEELSSDDVEESSTSDSSDYQEEEVQAPEAPVKVTFAPSLLTLPLMSVNTVASVTPSTGPSQVFTQPDEMPPGSSSIFTGSDISRSTPLQTGQIPFAKDEGNPNQESKGSLIQFMRDVLPYAVSEVDFQEVEREIIRVCDIITGHGGDATILRSKATKFLVLSHRTRELKLWAYEESIKEDIQAELQQIEDDCQAADAALRARSAALPRFQEIMRKCNEKAEALKHELSLVEREFVEAHDEFSKTSSLLEKDR